MAGDKGKRGGKRKGSGRKKGDPKNRGRGGASPKDFMNALVVAGPRQDHDEKAEYVEAEFVDADFTGKREYVDPVEFCQAVINGDHAVLSKCGVAEIPCLDQKLAAAKIAIKYTNKPKPVETVSKHQFSWVDEINEAEQRVKSMRMDIENDSAPETTH